MKQYYSAIKASLEEQEQKLLLYIQREFDDFLRCGRVEYSFLRVRCDVKGITNAVYPKGIKVQAYAGTVELKIPYRNGTTHVIFEPLDFMYRMYGMPRAQDVQKRLLPSSRHWYRNHE